MKGSVQLVVGGGSGIGCAAAQIMAQRGASVIVADRNAAAARAVAAELGGAATALTVDVSDEASVAAMVDAVIAAHGRLDGAINSAGMPPTGKPVHELTAEEWQRSMGVNLFGTFLCVKHQVRAMLAHGGGAICCISSASGIRGMVHSPDYCAGKAGVIGLVKAVAIDHALDGIRINALLPGATDTPLAHGARDLNPAIIGANPVPIGRMADPLEVGGAAVWLVSNEASYVTGAELSVDGGMTTGFPRKIV